LAKSGPNPSAHYRELCGVIGRECTANGVLLTFYSPSAAMRREAASAGT
jgi:hypothetical protein